MSDEFRLTEEQHSDGVAIVVVEGAIDLFTAPEFKDGLLSVIDRGATRIVLDLAQTSFLDSTALAVLLSARKRLAGRGGRLAVAGMNPNLAATFRLTGLDQLFVIETSSERAIAALSGEPEADTADAPSE